MHSKCSTKIHFPVRKVSLQQLAGLWSAVMACLPEVRHCAARFEHRGRLTREHVYDDADELAHADLDVRPGELRLSHIHISGSDMNVSIGNGRDTGPWSMLLIQPTSLKVDISGSNERDVLRLRTAIEQWGERNLEKSRLTLWLKVGVLAAVLVAAGVYPMVMDMDAGDAIILIALWLAFWKSADLFHDIQTRELRIVNAESIDGLPVVTDGEQLRGPESSAPP